LCGDLPKRLLLQRHYEFGICLRGVFGLSNVQQSGDELHQLQYWHCSLQWRVSIDWVSGRLLRQLHHLPVLQLELLNMHRLNQHLRDV